MARYQLRIIIIIIIIILLTHFAYVYDLIVDIYASGGGSEICDTP